VPKNAPNICPNVGWLPDFHEPQAILDVTFNGKRIPPVNNVNWSQLNDPKINKAIAHAETIIDPKARWAAWGKIDKMVTQSAAAVPWIWENFPTLYSKRVTPASELPNSGAPDETYMTVSGS
jgi:peptide/nickel transport system substrate-binding protein